MTVSRVINGDRNVRQSTRDAINAAIAALNYTPNPAARSLAGADQLRIGMLYSNPSAAYLSEFLVGGLKQARANDVQLVVEKCDDGDSDSDIEAARHLVASGIDGIILPPPLCDVEGIVSALIEADIPIVAVATGRSSKEVSTVRIDDFSAAHAMAQHIINLGHRRIGFIVGHPNQTASARRLQGYQAALREAGIKVQKRHIEQGYFTYRSGLVAADRLLGVEPHITAIFASNDDMAAAAVAAAHRRGFDVPKDLTVCGFDDSAFASSTWPELTTVRQPIAEMSRAAVELLVSKIRSRRLGSARKKSPKAIEHIQLDFVLVRRQSDAPPPAE